MAKQSHTAEQKRSLLLIVIGLGNQFRGDDSVGLVVAERLKQLKMQNVEVLEHSGDSSALIELWKGAHAAILVDAAHSGEKPGTIHRFELPEQRVPQQVFSRYSSHSVSLLDALELARTLNRLPPHLIVYGIEGRNFEVGSGLSPEVEAAADEVIQRVAEELESDLVTRNSDRRGE